jgi:cytochrome d ubiquinol oxidase subunit II
MEEVTLALVLVGLAAYLVLGGADFGAGLWDLTAGGARRGARVREMAHRSMGPVWEANHVWLIFVLVVLWTCFPRAFGPLMTTLYVPIFLAGVGIILRGGAFAFRGVAATIAQQRLFGATFALSSVLIPFFLGAAVGGVASGRVPAGGNGDALESWWNPTSVMIGALAVATGAYLAAVYLAADSQRAGLPDLVRAFRARALGAGVVAGGLALGGLAVVRSDARPLYEELTGGPALALVVVSGAAGVATLGLLWVGRYGLSRLTAAVAVAAIVAGWGLAQRPDVLAGTLTAQQAAAGDATLLAVLVSVGVGLIVLVPSLWWLYRLFLAGRLDTPFAPLDSGEQSEAGPRP